MEGTSLPDYGRCVSIVTGAALKEWFLPGILAVAMPLWWADVPSLQLEFQSAELSDVPLIHGCRSI